jgi:nucleoside-diphosphate-sugar epimerase
MTRIAVTGGSGFVGRHLVSRLSELNYSLRIATREPAVQPDTHSEKFIVDLITADVSTLSQFLEGCDVLVHLAGEIRDETKMQALNVDATLKLAEAAKASRLQHWVQISSCGVYGRNKNDLVTESSPIEPRGVYEKTKWESERIAQNLGSMGNCNVTIFRPSIIWSDDMPNDSLRKLVHMVKRGRFFYIGSPGSIYPLIHVDDVVRAVIASIERQKDGLSIFNLSDNISFEDLITAIAEITGSKNPSWRLPEWLVRMVTDFGRLVPGFPLTQDRITALIARTRYSSERAATELAWRPHTDLRKALKQFFKHPKNSL